MNESKISVRYAKALFALGKEENSLNELKSDMELLYVCIGEVSELQFILSSPLIKSAEKARLFRSAFEGAFSPLSITFTNLVFENRREDYLGGISRYFLTLLKKEQGILDAELVSAAPVTDPVRQSIVQLIEKKFKAHVELAEKTEPGLIGGFILRVGDQQLDASLSGKLKRIRTSLNEYKN